MADYTAPPPNQQGYPQQGYTAPPPQQGYTAPPPQQGYTAPPPQQGYPQQQQQVVITTTTTTGPNISSAWVSVFAYFFGFISGVIVLLLERESAYNIFHAWQSICISVVYLIGAIACSIIDIFFIPFGFRLLSFLWWVVFVIIWILCMVKAYNLAPSGQYFKLPLFGNFAESQANKFKAGRPQ